MLLEEESANPFQQVHLSPGDGMGVLSEMSPEDDQHWRLKYPWQSIETWFILLQCCRLTR
ncbi:hypothetical protein CARN8_6370001 [mine drainage metagenome]|uniref:Uncharacterized protein n=1 Tax=mine drainage metagenome TaxID=410659 RepID=A0A3P3ZR18_9ZZZZ